MAAVEIPVADRTKLGQNNVGVLGMKFWSINSIFFLLSFICALVFTTEASGAEKVKICSTAPGKDLVFPKNVEMKIESYDPKTKTYSATTFRLPGEDETIVTLDALAEAIPKLKRRISELRRNPESIVDEVYTPTFDVIALLPTERDARAGCTEK